MNILLFPRAAGREGMPACPFGDCRKGRESRCLHPGFWLGVPNQEKTIGEIQVKI